MDNKNIILNIVNKLESINKIRKKDQIDIKIGDNVYTLIVGNTVIGTYTNLKDLYTRLESL